ncbi:unnamed protein product [Moneuplotes crassus]|uniref:RRM domain-containing protein n=1 Tax=Euplotes crassus TaxID=5936 RepID=A0AAD1XVE3_EUPCR|nr:unnamed protein product [Moneuplotes crassus]
MNFETKVSTVDDFDPVEEQKTGKTIKYYTYTVKGNKKRIEERKKKWKIFNKDTGGAKERIGNMQKENHKDLDIVQKMQKRRGLKDPKLEEFQKRLNEVDSGAAQEELRKKEIERQIFLEEKRKREMESQLPGSLQGVNVDDLDMRSVKVSSIPESCTEEELIEIFSQYGKVWRCKIPISYGRNGKPLTKHKGFGFVNFEREEDAKRVVDMHEVEYGFTFLLAEYGRKPKDRS